ncbi:MAG: CDP-diacylglycerol--serine O-phosphatidyltransferase [Candidatus Sumerlaeota bacterium]|nr:CDP-diacylglycerol--serine O-phosphatidyltransferase [Candidatus Sumerlaeota bacterium]
MRKVYLLPNLFTTASLFCGLLSILNVFNVADAAEPNTRLYEMTCWLIILSAMLDMLDGWVARATRTESFFGAQYDSLSDVVAFGVAPAVLIYTRLSGMQNRHAAEVITTLYCICGALRLARFNVQKSTVEKESFTGLPIPAAAGVVVSGFLFFQYIDPGWDKKYVLNILPVMMVGLSYLMVSKINYPSFKQLGLERRKPFDVLPVIVILITIAIGLKNHLPTLLFIGFIGYVAWGVIWHAITSFTKTPEDSETKTI